MQNVLKSTVAKALSIAIATLFLLVIATSAFAQAEAGAISGKVTDPQDRVVPGATVTVKSVASGAERTTTTDDQGFPVYSLDSMMLRSKLGNLPRALSGPRYR